jgi:type II secretory ATPase GspE/PulE/Tfp pilus assembly ATPase PilB-like protein
LLRNVCQKCEENERQKARVEAEREWDLKQVNEDEERNWRPEGCPLCTGSMLVGYVWNSDSGDVMRHNKLQWVAGGQPPIHARSDLTILRNSDDMSGWRRAHLCETCGTLIVVQALRRDSQTNSTET